MHGFVMTYSDFFSQDPPDLEKVISKVPSKIAIQYLSYLCAELHSSPSSSDSEVQQDLMEGMIKRQPELVKVKMRSKFKELSSSASTLLFDTYTVMELLNRVLTNYNGSEAMDTDPNDEMNILMCVLIVNEKYNKYNEPVKGQGLLDLYCSMAWPYLIFSSELRLAKNHFHETYRGLCFSKHIEDNPGLKSIFKELHPGEDKPIFLYTSNVFGLYGNAYNKLTGKFGSRFPFDLEKVNEYIKPWILDITSCGPVNYNPTDYRTLRSYPIIKVYENCYCVSNWNFVLDKMYTGLLFDLYEKTSAFTNKEYKSFSGFKGIFGEAFSEKLCHDLIKSALPSTQIISGDPNSAANHDIYFREGRRIALIEHKDPLFVKHDEYLKIKEVIDNKLITKQGVKQLIEHIKKLRDDPAFIEQGLKYKVYGKKLLIYPIIIVTDSAFALTGMEDYVNKCFKQALKELGQLPFYVHRLIILDIYSLMNMHDHLVSMKINFFNQIDKYYRTKQKLKKLAIRRAMTTSDISSQFQGFSELVGYKMKPVITKKEVPYSLKNKMFEQLKSFGVQENGPG